MFGSRARLSLTALLLTLLVVAAPAFGQASDAYQVNYFSNALSLKGGVGEIYDQTVSIINTGQIGSPIDSATNQGTVCAEIYVFDTNQEMVSCCSCPITANGLLRLSVNDQLLGNVLTGSAPSSGVVKIVSDLSCNPFSIGQPVSGGLRAFGTHQQGPPEGTTPSDQIITETEFQRAPLQDPEAGFLGNACSFVQYLGSGRGTCDCALEYR